MSPDLILIGEIIFNLRALFIFVSIKVELNAITKYNAFAHYNQTQFANTWSYQRIARFIKS